MQEQPNQRITSLDALRGLAVLFMLFQHIAYWLSSHPHNSLSMQAIGAVGGLAAPVFIVLAGMGATFLARKEGRADLVLVQRGLLIIFFGYALNLLAPSWFTPQSWYVLQMIGFGILLSPILVRLPDGALAALLFPVMLFTAVIQTQLGTPVYLTNHLMGGGGLPDRTLRLILAESYFPVFPWIAFFLSGILAGRWLLRDRKRLILRFALLLAGLSVVLSSLYLAGLTVTGSGVLMRLTRPIPNFYPSLAPLSLFLIALVLILVVAFRSLQDRIEIQPANPLVCLGRSSLTIIMVHIIFIRESAVYFGFWRSYSLGEALALTLLMVILFTALARLWYRAGFKYGAEWLVRLPSAKYLTTTGSGSGK